MEVSSFDDDRLLNKNRRRARRPRAGPTARRSREIARRRSAEVARIVRRGRDDAHRGAPKGDKGDRVLSCAALAAMRPTVRMVSWRGGRLVVPAHVLRAMLEMNMRSEAGWSLIVGPPRDMRRRGVAQSLNRDQAADDDRDERAQRKASSRRERSHDAILSSENRRTSTSGYRQRRGILAALTPRRRPAERYLEKPVLMLFKRSRFLQ